jgi:hypothetical protein
MAIRTTETFSFSAWIQIAVAIIGIIGFVVTVVQLFLAVQWSPRRANELPQLGRPLKIIRIWRPSHYSLALGYLEEYCQRLISRGYDLSGKRGYVTEYDLVRWTFQIALTCAAYMVPHSLGKANLFRVSQIVTDAEPMSPPGLAMTCRFMPCLRCLPE